MDLQEKTQNPHRHPWELSRADQLFAQIATLPQPAQHPCLFADIGSGDLFFAEKLSSLTSEPVQAVDTGYQQAMPEHSAAIQCSTDLQDLQECSVNRMVMMDVLEHVPEPEVFLQEALTKLQPSGYLILTVPALQMLFSAHDTFLHHYRRYSRKRLLATLRKSGLQVKTCHYFYGSLVLPRLLSCMQERIRRPKPIDMEGIGQWNLPQNHWKTHGIRQILNQDFRWMAKLNRCGLHPPGLSLFAICQKKA